LTGKKSSAVRAFSTLILCSVLLFNSFSVSSQNKPKEDSLKLLLERQDLSLDQRIQTIYWLSVYSISPEDQLKYAQRVIDLAEKSGNQYYIIRANMIIGVAHRQMGNLGQALEHLLKGAAIAAESEKYDPILANIYTEISTCYTQNDDSENALMYGLKTIDILRKTGNKRELAINLLNTGYDYYTIAQYDSALKYYNEAESLFLDQGMDIGLAYISGNRALVFWKKGDFEQARSGLFKAIEMLEPLGDSYGMADYYNQLGHVFMEQEDDENAIIYARKGLEFALQEGLKEQIRDASYLLFLLNENAGNYQEALNYQSQYFAYKDSIQNLETTQRLANLRTQFEVGQKQAEVDLLLEQKRNNQIIMIAGGIMLVIVTTLVLVIFYSYQSKTRLSNQLREQKDSLVVLNNTKDKFFSIISHDLRGPVGALRGLLYAIKRNWDDMDPEELKDILGQMENSADRLVKLLDNLLHWALQQKGHFPYTPEMLRLKETLREVADLFSEMAASKDIKIELQMSEDCTVFVDKNATMTIFRNLLNNAVKFTPSEGLIQISVNKNESIGMAEIRFEDNGVGIPEDKLKKLFELNENISTKGTSGESGLGLGLQLVYEFVELNKGRISVESEEQKGTAFKVLLPLNSNKSNAA